MPHDALGHQAYIGVFQLTLMTAFGPSRPAAARRSSCSILLSSQLFDLVPVIKRLMISLPLSRGAQSYPYRFCPVPCLVLFAWGQCLRDVCFIGKCRCAPSEIARLAHTVVEGLVIIARIASCPHTRARWRKIGASVIRTKAALQSTRSSPNGVDGVKSTSVFAACRAADAMRWPERACPSLRPH